MEQKKKIMKKNKKIQVQKVPFFKAFKGGKKC